MKTRIAFVFGASLGCFGSAAFAQPMVMVTGATPTRLATAGMETVTITGANFGASGSVTIDSNPCTPTMWSSDTIRCISPSGMGVDRPLVVTTSGSASAPFLVSYALPRVDTITPLDGPTSGGPTLTLSGANLGVSGVVTIGGAICSPSSWGHTRVQCALPPGQGSAAEVIVAVGGQRHTSAYRYARPLLLNVAPTSGPASGGTLVTLTGMNFGPSPVVTIGSGSCVVMAASHSAITCRTPAGAGPQRVTVRAADQSSTEVVTFMYPSETLDDAGADAADAANGADATNGADAASDGALLDGASSDALSTDAASLDDATAEAATADAARDASIQDGTVLDSAAADGATTDAGPRPVAGGGCGCVVSTGPSRSSLGWLAAVAALSAVARRRRAHAHR